MTYVIAYLRRRFRLVELEIPESPFGQHLGVLSSHPESLRITRGETIFTMTLRGNPELRSRMQNVLDLDTLWIRIQSAPLLSLWMKSNEIFIHAATTPHGLSRLVFSKKWRPWLAAVAFWTIKRINDHTRRSSLWSVSTAYSTLRNDSDSHNVRTRVCVRVND